MDHIANVGLVDAHAERDSRHHHRLVLVEKLVQPVVAHAFVETGVIGHGRDAGGGKAGGQALGPVARSGIDHAAAPAPLLDQFEHAGVRPPRLALGRQCQFRPGEAGDEFRRALKPKLLDDVLARASVGGGGDCQARRVGEDVGEAA